MFASFFEFFKYLFGVEWHFLKLFQMFGFFMVLAFIVGGIVLSHSLKRLEKLGEIKGIRQNVKVGAGANIFGIIFNGFFGSILGYKVGYMFLNSSEVFDNPQAFLLSGKGSIIGAIVFAILFAMFYFWDANKGKLAEPRMEEQTFFPSDLVSEMLVVAAVSGIIGAKVFASVEDWENFTQDPMGSLMAFSGLTYYGGLIFGATAVIIYALKRKIPLKSLMDVSAPSLILGYGVGRLGCHFSGDGDWGIPISGPNKYIAETYEYVKPNWMSIFPDWMWAYNYPNNVAQEGVKIPDCVGPYCYVLDPAVFPTSIYEFIFGVLIFLILIGIRNKLKYPGLLFAIYLMLNGIERFFIESIRVNDRYNYFGMDFSQAQYIALGLLLFGILLFVLFRLTGKKFLHLQK